MITVNIIGKLPICIYIAFTQMQENTCNEKQITPKDQNKEVLLDSNNNWGETSIIIEFHDSIQWH